MFKYLTVRGSMTLFISFESFSSSLITFCSLYLFFKIYLNKVIASKLLIRNHQETLLDSFLVIFPVRYVRIELES